MMHRCPTPEVTTHQQKSYLLILQSASWLCRPLGEGLQRTWWSPVPCIVARTGRRRGTYSPREATLTGNARVVIEPSGVLTHSRAGRRFPQNIGLSRCSLRTHGWVRTCSATGCVIRSQIERWSRCSW